MRDYSKENKERIIDSEDFDYDRAKSELDRLFEDVRSYRTSQHFMRLMRFCREFKHLAPFNAMMVDIQRPGCRYVLTARQWKAQWHRDIKPNARPVVILSYQPISYLFDISDTESNDGFYSNDEFLLEEIKSQYDTKQAVEKYDLDVLVNNLPTLGIAYSDGFRAGGNFAAKIQLLDRPQVIQIPVSKDKTIMYTAHYLISVNETLSVGARYASILHELGHLLCHHLSPPPHTQWWKSRSLSHADREFEAEAVAWLTCERLNIENPSERYLAGYEQEMIPENVSIDHIFKAHNEIWKLLFNQQYAKKSFLYKKDETFKDMVLHS